MTVPKLFEMEHFSRDAFRVKRSYIDITEDLTAGILLGQIVYWNLPNEKGKSKLRVIKDGELWLAKGRSDWHDEIRIKPRQFDRAIEVLREKDFVETRLYKFDGVPTVHIKLNTEVVHNAIMSILRNGEMEFTHTGNELPETVKSLTEITTEITTEKKDSRQQQAADTKKPSKKYDDESDYMKLADFFVKQIRNNKADFKQPNMQKWADDFRKLVELDSRDKREISRIIKWAQQDSFESGVVLSPDKLRKRYDELAIKMSKAAGTANGTEPQQPQRSRKKFESAY